MRERTDRSERDRQDDEGTGQKRKPSQAEGEPQVPEGGEPDGAFERPRPSQAEGDEGDAGES